ncbi:MAG: hypothetical protein ACREJC_12575, partial [Tepidisphaeraceae bacterium]
CYARAVSLASFALSALSAFGLHRLMAATASDDRWRRRAPAVLAGVMFAVMFAITAWVTATTSPGPFKPPYESLRQVVGESLRLSNQNGIAPLILAALTAAVLLWGSFGMTRTTAIAIVVIAVVDCASFAWSFCPTTSPDLFTRVPESAKFLQSQPGPFRTVTYITDDLIQPEEAQKQLAVSWAMAYGLEDINGFNSLQPRRHTTFFYGPDFEDVTYGTMRDPGGTSFLPPSARLNMLDVHYAIITPQYTSPVHPSWSQVYQDDQVRIYKFSSPSGRAHFVRQVVPDVEEPAVSEAVRFNDFPGDKIALVEGPMDPDTVRAVTTAGDADVQFFKAGPNQLGIRRPTVSYAPYEHPASVSIQRRSANEMVLKTRTDQPRFLVVSESWYPGWHARLTDKDGKESVIPIYRTNYLFRGVVVPAGEATVRMFYRPGTIIWGGLITLLSIFGSLGAIAVERWSRATRLWQRAAGQSAKVLSRGLAPDPRMSREDQIDLTVHKVLMDPHERLGKDAWLARCLSLLAAAALGAALQTRDGLISPGAITWLLTAVALTTVAVCVPRLSGLRWHDVRPEFWILGAAIALEFALILGILPGVYPNMPNWTSTQLTAQAVFDYVLASYELLRPFLILCGIAAVLAGSMVSARPVLGRFTFPAVLVVAALMGIWMLKTSPNPRIDVFTFQTDAGTSLFARTNPYSITFPDEYPPGAPYYGEELRQNGRLMFGYPYMPLTLLITAPVQWILADYRYAQLCAMLAAAALIALARPGRLGTLVATFFLFTPRTFFVLEQGWTEPLVALALCATVVCASRARRLLPYCLGIFLVSKQYCIFAALVTPLLLSRENWRKELWPLAWRAVLTGAVVTLPLVLWDFKAFWHSAVMLQFHQPFRYDALSFLSWGQTPASPVPGSWVAFAAMIVAAGLCLWRCERNAGGFALGVAAMFLAFFAFNKQAFANYYYLVIAALCCAGASLGRPTITTPSDALDMSTEGSQDRPAPLPRPIPTPQPQPAQP